MLHWWNFKRILPVYVEDFLPPLKRRIVDRHVQGCLECREELAQLEHAGTMLRAVPPASVPAELPFRIRQRINRERRRPIMPSLAWRLKNRAQPFVFPAAAGLISALLIFGTFVRVFEIPVHADTGDVPLRLHTPPRLRSGALLEANTGIQCMKVKILVDQNGRVADFHIVKGKQTPEQIRDLQTLLVFSVFDPATVFGKPTPETIVLSLKNGHLKGLSL